MISREAAVDVARSFLGTPYVLGGHIKGGGVDCATLLAEWLIECGFADREELGIYSHDWFCHTKDELYMLRLLRHAQKTLDGICRGTVDAKPGALILFRVAKSKVFNHGGIITHWPYMVHAADPRVQEHDATKHWMTEHMAMAIFDPWEKDATR